MPETQSTEEPPDPALEVDVTWSAEDQVYIAHERRQRVKAHGDTATEALRELADALELIHFTDMHSSTS